MNRRQSTAALYVALATLAVAGVISVLVGFYAGAILLPVALVLAVVERGRLATSTRPPNPELRRQLLIASAILAVVCIVSTTAFMIELGDDEHWAASKLIAYNTVFFATAAAALACLIAGLRTRRTA
jgi:4-amino-4-deoxy-L-arabinose transferase-like glycosyltransferase